jgi:hypothetical protein
VFACIFVGSEIGKTYLSNGPSVFLLPPFIVYMVDLCSLLLVVLGVLLLVVLCVLW